MDPITITTTIITLATFFKDALELALSLKESVEKIGLNKHRLGELVDDIHDTLSQLEQFYESHDLSDESTFELSHSLERLKGEIQTVLERCQEVLPRSSSRHFGAVKAKVKAWHMRDDIEADIFRLRERIVAYHGQFTAFATARIEHTAVRMEQSLLIQRVEHRSKLDRLEVLMTNMFLDTQNAPAQAILRRMSVDLAADLAKQGIEAQYLRLQVKNLATGITHGLPLIIDRYTEEKVKWLQTPFSPVYQAAIPGNELVVDVLTFSRWLEVNDDKYPIFKVQTMALHLHRSAMYSDALALYQLLVQIFRQLVVKDTFRFLPRLALALQNLALTQKAMGAFDDAQATMQSATASMELVKEQYPDYDFRDLAAFISATHALVFAREGQFDECLRISKQAHDEQVTLLAAVEKDPVTGFVKEGRDASLILLVHRSQVTLAESLCNTGSPAEAFDMAKSALRLLFSLSRDYIKRVSLNDTPPRILKIIFTSLAGIYQTTGGSLSLAEDIIHLYRELVKQHPERYSGHLIRILFAFSYLCHIQAENLEFKLLEDQRAIFGSIILDNGKPTRHCHFDAFIAYMKTRDFGEDILKNTILTFLTFDRTENFVPYSLEEEVGELISAIVLDDIPLGVDAIRQAILYYRKDLDETVDSEAFIKALYLVSQFANEIIPIHTSTFLPILEELHIMARDSSKEWDGKELSWIVSADVFTSATIKASKFVEARVLSKESRETASDTPTSLFEVLATFAREWYTMGQLDDSLQCISDGIALAKKLPPTHENGHICYCLYHVNLSASILDSLGFKDESTIVLEEALRLCPEMHDHECDRAGSMVAHLARMLTEQGRPEDALEISEQAIDFATAQGNDDFEHAYARDVRAKCLAALGRHEEALQLAEEGMERRRKGMEHLSKREAEIQTLSLSRVLANSGYADCLAHAERTTEALAAVDEAVRVLRLYHESHIGRWPTLALILEQRSQLLWRLERKEEALETCEEVIKIRRSIGGRYFKERVLLPTALERLAEYLRAMGRVVDATAAQDEAASIRTGIETKADKPPASQEAIVSAMMDRFPRYRAQRLALLNKSQLNGSTDKIPSPPVLSSRSESSTASSIPATSRLMLHREFGESSATLVAEPGTIDSEEAPPHPTLTDINAASRPQYRTPPPSYDDRSAPPSFDSAVDEKVQQAAHVEGARRRASRRHTIPLPTLDSGRGRMETIKQNVTFAANLVLIIWALLKAWAYLSDWARSLNVQFSL